MADRQSRQLSVPHKFNSLVAAAEVMTSKSVTDRPKKAERLMEWQQRSLDYYDAVGEYRFGVGWLGNAMSRVNLVGASPPTAVGDEPTPIDLDDDELTPVQRRTAELVSFIAGGTGGQGQMLSGFGKLLSITGFAWLVAEPDLEDEFADTYVTWKVYSQRAVDVRDDPGGKAYWIATGNPSKRENWRRAHPNALVVKCWRPHPDRPWEPDAPVRAVLGVLEQLDLLGAHITASGRSRLAGAGLLIVPTEATFPDPPPPEGDTPDAGEPQDGFDYFVDQMTLAFTIPIKDRDNAAAVVPLTIQVPGEFVDKVKHLTFATPFDAQVINLQQEAIQRFALGMDMPPEVLTGMAGVNHWTAWQVEETAVTLHIEPCAEIVCQALTEGFLKAALAAEGLDPNEGMVWYTAQDLTTPPDKSANAAAGYDRIELSGSAFRRESGFNEDDAPDEDEFKQRILLAAAQANPALAPAIYEAMGLISPEMAAAAKAAEATPALPAADDETPENTDTGTPPITDRPGPESPDSAAVIAACDGIVHRAMERAGSRLRSSIGRKVQGGPQAVEWTDMATLHTQYDATVYADYDMLLDGAFDRVPEIAEFLGVDGPALVSVLTAYCRGLLGAQHAHDLIRLSGALGADALV